VRTQLPVEVTIESRVKIWSDLSIDLPHDVPVEWSNEMPTEWWAELRIEVPSKVPSEMPVELPSPESNAWLSCESGPERTGECEADYRWNSCGQPSLQQLRNGIAVQSSDAGSEQMPVRRSVCCCERASVLLKRQGADLRPPRETVARRALLPGHYHLGDA